MKVYIVTIGDELLIGQVIDSNSAWIAKELNQVGIAVSEILSISDMHKHITGTLKAIENKADLVIMTGGLGPTRDDITKSAMADYLDKSLNFYPEIEDHIKYLFDKINKPEDHIHREQCLFPEGSILIKNERGTAPGIWMQGKNTYILSMPGVPHEMKYIMQSGGIDKIKKLNPNQKTIIHRTLKTAGIGEDTIARKIDHLIDNYPDNLKLAYLPSIWEVRIRLSAEGSNQVEVEQLIQNAALDIENILGNNIYGYDNDTLASVIGKLLAAEKQTISLAESCTIGKASHTIGNISGASGYLQGGIVAYSNKVKMNILGVKKETLTNHGAVSDACVQEMLAGLLDLMKTDIGIAISGIAGPNGGSEEKPVGTVWIAYGSKEDLRSKKFNFGTGRDKVIERATVTAINLVRLYLLENQ